MRGLILQLDKSRVPRLYSALMDESYTPVHEREWEPPSPTPAPSAARRSWLDRALPVTIRLETALFCAILLFGLATRFVDLGTRVMSHDENSHVYYSWLLSRGEGYEHNPITHGPLQFHLVALTYFLLGDSDFTARIPAALFSVGTIAFTWFYRRYLGRVGTLAAALLFAISPYMLFYGRYVRNEAFVALFGLATLWAILRYLESGAPRYLFYLTLATVLHFTAKETAFIYTAQALVFLALYQVYRFTRNLWLRPGFRRRFTLALGGGALLAILAAGLYGLVGEAGRLAAASAGGLALLALAAALVLMLRGYGWAAVREERAFGLLVLLGTLVLPMLAPFPVKALGHNPIDYTSTQSILVTGAFVAATVLLAVSLGLAWRPRLWLQNAALFYGVFIVLYTTFFTNGIGLLTGLVGSLGYWLEQQGVNRGEQPLYYYALIQIPIYEYLPALGTLLAAVLALRSRARAPLAGREDEAGSAVSGEQSPPVLALLFFWTVSSLAAFSIAGEKMPWLTVHIVLPMILLSGWATGRLVEGVDWAGWGERWGWPVLALLLVLMGSSLTALGMLLGLVDGPGSLPVLLLTGLAAAAGLAYLARSWPSRQFAALVMLVVIAGLGLLTTRTAFRAAYLHYDDGLEYLVYAHGSAGVKQALDKIETISRRTTNGLALAVAYDEETRYPFWWYLRHYPNAYHYGLSPTRQLREYPVILVGRENLDAVEPILGEAYYRYDYTRLAWPNQDYFRLKWAEIDAERHAMAAQGLPEGQPAPALPPMTVREYLRLVWERIRPFFLNVQVRQAVWQIWLNRDYRAYGELRNVDMSLPDWQPADPMRLYVRMDVLAQMWDASAPPAELAGWSDPYAGKGLALAADTILGGPGRSPGEFQGPRDLLVAQDGSLYVADTGNHRIQHLDEQGNMLHVWGAFGDAAQRSAPGGTFNQPWGIAQGPDGSIYVADTWNHRIQKFTPQGEWIAQWGHYGQTEAPDAFYGPRDVVVDSRGRVFVSDTGNKRVVVFDESGRYLAEFGGTGTEPGEMEEPVGLALDAVGRLYVAEPWNGRVQVFLERESNRFQVTQSWEVDGWYGDTLDNKPYLSVDAQGRVLTVDPEARRVLVFDERGELLHYWGEDGAGAPPFSLPAAAAPDRQGRVWVSDAGSSRLLRFPLP